jgi:hypothetical protein
MNKTDPEQHAGVVSQPNGGRLLQTSQSLPQQYARGWRDPDASLRPLSNWIDGMTAVFIWSSYMASGRGPHILRRRGKKWT